jgi:cytochrome c peroxidase
MEDDAKAIDAYLGSLKPIPSPRFVDGKLSPVAEKGKQTFQKLGCAKCHNGAYFSDRKLHDVGTWTSIDMTIENGVAVKQTHYVTARLVEMWRTAPYFHTGEYYTVESLIEKSNHTVINPAVKKLTDNEKHNLIEYILSL